VLPEVDIFSLQKGCENWSEFDIILLQTEI